MNFQFSFSLPEVFFILLGVSLLSGLFMIFPKVPLWYVRIHIGVISLPPMTSLLALITERENKIFGPWHLDSLAWLMAVFVLTIGFVVQKYSVRYLLGDYSYRKYFSLLTLTTVADTTAWLSDDLHWLLAGWGITLLGLTWLLKLNKQWYVAKKAGMYAGRMFAISWLLLLSASLWITQITGQWQISQVLTADSLAQFTAWEKTSITLLLIFSVMIPAGQFPFHRWLLDSVVAPTPVSAVMHAGIVNAGGILLTRFAPLFSGGSTQFVLLAFTAVSVIIGTGIMLVQADYKRQLVGSTIAQMGFMLIQIALQAYLAAIIHAVLHGLFKSTLFLQAGSVLRHKNPMFKPENRSSFFLTIIGGSLGILVGIGFWLTAPQEGYQLVSSIILAWSVSIAWTQLVAVGTGRISRVVGIFVLAITATVYGLIHAAFYRLLHGAIQIVIQPPSLVTALILIVLLGSTAFGTWLARNRSSTAFGVIYLWLVHFGEPHHNLVESHPKHLAKIMSRGGHSH
ncbi:NADH dehydrogenase subunit 5 [Neobacillus sp. SM06]|uniref:NADH dehydrogenase subunit 5 n=1 Tax=Neobacillus sp. SM06 TaxID=3422492 RepID=UPI003D274646